MKNLGYGSHYSYNPDFAHPVVNDYLPRTIAAKTSLAATPTAEAILRTPDAEATDKVWDEGRLKDWEERVNDGKPWEGREARREMMAAGKAVHKVAGDIDEEQYTRGTEHNPRAGRKEA